MPSSAPRVRPGCSPPRRCSCCCCCRRRRRCGCLFFLLLILIQNHPARSPSPEHAASSRPPAAARSPSPAGPAHPPRPGSGSERESGGGGEGGGGSERRRRGQQSISSKKFQKACASNRGGFCDLENNFVGQLLPQGHRISRERRQKPSPAEGRQPPQHSSQHRQQQQLSVCLRSGLPSLET